MQLVAHITWTVTLERVCAALADEEALREGKLRALREAVKLHQQRLGLRFQHHDGTP